MRIALVQFASSPEKAENVKKAEEYTRDAAKSGAKIICYHELFNTDYFCYEMDKKYFRLAEPIPGPTTEQIGRVAKEEAVVIVAPLFERVTEGEFYSSAAVIGPDGEIMGVYRKNHIPLIGNDEFTCSEKFYFRPGNLGFPVFVTPYGVTLGILICFDRHFPEAARILALRGADIIFASAAAASSKNWMLWRDSWETELKAHAVANLCYVAGVNKVGRDSGLSNLGADMHYFGSSMVVNPVGEVIAKAGDQEDEVIYADIERVFIEESRSTWFFYRDRRPDSYGFLIE